MRLTLTLFFSAAAFLSMGQFKPGVVRGMENQEVAGFIKVLGVIDGTQVCLFKDSETSESTMAYRPEQIVSYQVVGENPFFSGAILDSGIVKYFFFERITGGKLSLYTLKKRLVINSENGQFTEITSTNYREALALPFSECSYAQSALPKLEFDQKALAKVIKQHNECVRSASPQTYQPKKKVTASYGVFVGLDNSNVTFESSATSPAFSGQTLSNIKPFTVGFQTWLGFSKLPDQLRVVLGLNYSQKQYNGLSQSGGTSNVNNLYFSEFQFPLRLQYTFLQRNRIACFVSAGSSFAIVQGFESSQIWDTSSGNSIYINEIAPFTSLDKGMDFHGGLGGTLGLAKNSRIVVTLSYAKGAATFGNGTNVPAKSTIGTFSFTTGYLF